MRFIIAKFCLVLGICSFAHSSDNEPLREKVIRSILRKQLKNEEDLFSTKDALYIPETGEVNLDDCKQLHAFFTVALDTNPRDKVSHTYFGYFYENGLGFDRVDDQKAIFHYKIAALQGVVFAQKQLASQLYRKVNRKKSSDYDAKFLYWAKKLGKQGHLESLINLRKYYNSMATHRRDTSANRKALKWVRKAAEAGDHESMRIYASRLERGIGCEKNDENDRCALFWYLEDAKTNSCPESMYDVARCYESGVGCEISEDSDKIAFKYYQLAVDYNAGELAMLKLADMLCDGIGCEESFLNEIKANKYYLKAATEYSSIEAMLTLSSNYFKGVGCTGDEKDHAQAMYWLERAHKLGDTDSSLRYANNLMFGKGCQASEENRRHALKIALKLASQEEKKAMLLAGLMLCHGIGCPETARNQEDGVSWLEKAALEGVNEACFHLGYCLLNGIGYEDTVVAKRDAINKFQLAADKKIKRANHALAHCLLLGLNDSSTAGFRIIAVMDESVAEPDAAYYTRLALAARQLHLDQAKAVKLLKQSVEDGFIDSHAYLGFCLIHNIGCAVAPDSRKVGLNLLRDAAVEDNKFSKDFLAYIYTVGYQGIKQSTKLALRHSLQADDTELNLLIQLFAFLSDKDYKSATESIKKLTKLENRTMIPDDVLKQIQNYINKRNIFSVIKFSSGRKVKLSKKEKNKLFTPSMQAQLTNVVNEYKQAMIELSDLIASDDQSIKKTDLQNKQENLDALFKKWIAAIKKDYSETNVVLETQSFLNEFSTLQEQILLSKVKSFINVPFEYWTKKLFGTPFGFMPAPETDEITEDLKDEVL